MFQLEKIKRLCSVRSARFSVLSGEHCSVAGSIAMINHRLKTRKASVRRPNFRALEKAMMC